MYDIIIIGGGPAGMTAAIYGLRAGKRVLLIEGTTFGGQITLSPRVENYPGIIGMSGNEFAAALTEQIDALGAEMEYTTVTSIKTEGPDKIVVTEDGEFKCRSIILAVGVSHRHLGLEKEKELIGHGVSYCAVCDGAFFKGMDVAVVGGGSTALSEAVFLSQYCKSVSLIHRREEFRGEPKLVELVKNTDNIQMILNSVVTAFIGEDSLEGVEIRNKQTLEKSTLNIGGLFVAVGQIPNNEIFSEIVRLNEFGYILSSEDCMTSSGGIFAAGDCRTKEVRQLTTAVADGAVAALAACKYVDEMKEPGISF